MEHLYADEGISGTPVRYSALGEFLKDAWKANTGVNGSFDYQVSSFLLFEGSFSSFIRYSSGELCKIPLFPAAYALVVVPLACIGCLAPICAAISVPQSEVHEQRRDSFENDMLPKLANDRVVYTECYFLLYLSKTIFSCYNQLRLYRKKTKMKVKKAIIFVAGLGTRVLLASKAISKEMLPLVDGLISNIL